MKSYIAELSIRITLFLNCCKEFGVFDIANVLQLDAWESYQICESLATDGVVHKVDEYSDDPDFDDIVYILNLQIESIDRYGIIYNAIDSLDDDILDSIRPPRLAIKSFASAMEAKMRYHDSQKGDSWEMLVDNDLEAMFNNKMSELTELVADSFIFGDRNKQAESEKLVDIANFCMLIWNRNAEC